MSISNGTGTIINTKPMIFSHLFHTGRFEVPWHQRRYDWTKEHVWELLRDIDEAVREKRKCYFLGAIMLLQKDERVWEINDGQQRMVTFSLICACLCRLFYEASEQLHENRALRVLFNLDVNSTARLPDAAELDPRLTPPRDDKTRYNLMIRGESIGTNGKLTDAWAEIERFFEGMEIEKHKQFMDYLLNNIEVACLYIPDDVDPNSVYETLNCRGKQLEDLDLIRNYLYSYFNAAEEQPRRDTVHDNLENIRTQLRTDAKTGEYARCYFQCKYGFLPKQKFYRTARIKIRSLLSPEKPADDIYNLVTDFARQERVEIFQTITNPSATDSLIKTFQTHSNSNRTKRNLSIFLQELKNYKVAQPMVFALLNRYVMESNATEKRRLAKRIHGNLKHITSFVMRTAFVAPKFEPSHFESEFSSLAKKIMSAEKPDNIDIMRSLKEFDGTYGIIDDDRFIDKMKVVEMRNTRDTRRKRFLLGVNHSIQRDSSLLNETQCTVEHIFPRSEEHWQGWHNFEEHNPEDWVHRLGNLTLLGQEDNKPGRDDNRDFSRKKEVFDRSAITLTRELLDREDWSPKAITARQEKLAKIAAKEVWSF